MEKFLEQIGSAEESNENVAEVEKEAVRNLKDLGLDFGYLKNKLTLDIGAGAAEIAAVAKNKGIEVVSLDLNPGMWAAQGVKIPDVPYVRASAEAMPFPDKKFDLIISHAGPLSIVPSKKLIASIITEAKRVLKDGGELRFGPGNLNSEVFTTEELFSQEEMTLFTREQRIERIEQKSLEFLKSLDPRITQEKIDEPSGDLAKHFYRLKKAVDWIGK